MKIFRLPDQCAAIIFDMDGTLYTNPEYVQIQIDLPVKRLAQLQGKSFDEMNREVARFRSNWAHEHEGRQISLGNTLINFGISIQESIKWKAELYQPEQHLGKDLRLRSVLEQLESRFALSVVTNNPVSIAARTLAVLGVDDLFHAIVGLDTCSVSKPNEQILMRATALCDTKPEHCVSVGDRFDIDIALPLEMGMGGILVDGVEDVYKLPELLV